MQKVFLDNLPRNKSGRIRWADTVGNSVPFQYNDLVGEIKIVDYKPGKGREQRSTLLVEYNGNNTWVTTHAFTVPVIGNIINKHNFDFIYNIGDEIKTENTKLVVLDRKRDTRKQYYLECLTCHTKAWYTENHILSGKSNYICGTCGQHRYKEGFNDIPTAAPWMIPYFQGGEEEAKKYSIHSTHAIYPVCPDCGKISSSKRKINRLFQNKGFVCDCNLYGSYGEKLVGEVLKQNNIEYIHDKTLEWSNGKRYDYILNKYNIIIEVDGEFNHGFYQPWKSYEQSEKEFEDDEYKNRLASQNGFNILRLVYLHDYKAEFIDEIKTGLPNIFWEKTDWDKAILNILHKSKYDICVEYKESDKTCAFIDYLSSKYSYSESSIRNILKFGNINGWCVYPKNKKPK